MHNTSTSGDNIAMKHNSKNLRSHCPINFVLETFGDKWTLLIIRDLMFKGKVFYGEFLSSAENISTSVLAKRLQKLESQNIIKKTVDRKNRSKLRYALTEKGKGLLPIMLEITAWSARYDDLSNVPKSFVEALHNNKDGLLKKLSQDLNNKPL